MTLGDVIAALERLYPPETAQDWDRVGLVTGDLAQPVGRIHFALDPTLAVIQEALEHGADLLVSHHPLLLRGVHSVATSSAKGAAVTAAVVGGLAIYCAHTNADVARPGVSDALAAACGLTDVVPLTHEHGYAVGRVGVLPAPMSLGEFVARLASALPSTAGGLRVAGAAGEAVHRVAVVGGSGDDRFEAVRASGADVYVTADLRHHPALEAREESRGGPPYLVDAGHWATEWGWLVGAEAELVRHLLREAGLPVGTVETYVSRLRTEPWDFVVGANADGGLS